MSTQKEKHPTSGFVEVIVHNASSQTKFVIPQSAVKKLIAFIKSLQIDNTNDDELIPADIVLKEYYEKHGKTRTIIRGYRYRDGLTQKDLAKKLNMPLAHISQIEHGKRVIDKKLAQKLAKIFNTTYRMFL